jgi:hypothetical protein
LEKLVMQKIIPLTVAYQMAHLTILVDCQVAGLSPGSLLMFHYTAEGLADGDLD